MAPAGHLTEEWRHDFNQINQAGDGCLYFAYALNIDLNV